MRRVTKRPRKKVRKTRRRRQRNYRKMRGGEGKQVTVNVYDIIGGGVLFTIHFDYYPEYKVENVYTELTKKITDEFEEYHSSGVSGGTNAVTYKNTNSVIRDTKNILADIEIYANNPSIKVAGETNTLPDGTTVQYKGLYEQITTLIKEKKIDENNRHIVEIKKAYVDAIAKRDKLRKTPPQLSSVQSQQVTHPLEFTVQPATGTIAVRPRNKGTAVIYTNSEETEKFDLRYFTSQLNGTSPSPSTINVYVN